MENLTNAQQADSLKAFADALKAAKSQVAMASTLGVSQAQISRMSRGEIPIDASVAASIQKFYQVPKYRLRPDIFDPPRGYKPPKPSRAKAGKRATTKG